jgi:biotin carboxylase
VLGGGRHQVPLIRAAEERGVEVVLVDYLPDAPGRAVATHSLVQDALDSAAAIDAGRRFGIDGVVTTGTDLAVVTMADVAAALGLPFWISPDAARTATDKTLMHGAFEAHGVAGARRLLLMPADEPDVGDVPYPVVVKPADSQGQRGVTRVDGVAGLPAAVELARRHSATRRVLVEQFLTGPEITANAWVQGGDVVLLAVNDRVSYNPPPHIGVAYQHVHPSHHALPHLDDIRDQLRRVATAYGMANGPLYAQMIVGDDRACIVEAAARVGGGHESSMFPLITGTDVESRLLDLALTGTCEPFGYDMTRADPPAHVAVTFVLGRAGTVDRFESLDSRPDGIVEAGWYCRPGTELGDVRDSLGRIGYFVTVGSDRDDLDRRSEAFYRSLKVLDAAGNNLVLEPEPALVNR